MIIIFKFLLYNLKLISFFKVIVADRKLDLTLTKTKWKDGEEASGTLSKLGKSRADQVHQVVKKHLSAIWLSNILSRVKKSFNKYHLMKLRIFFMKLQLLKIRWISNRNSGEAINNTKFIWPWFRSECSNLILIWRTRWFLRIFKSTRHCFVCYHLTRSKLLSTWQYGDYKKLNIKTYKKTWNVKLMNKLEEKCEETRKADQLFLAYQKKYLYSVKIWFISQFFAY